MARSPDDVFTPTPAMRRYAAACARAAVPARDDARCESAGVAATSLARWRRDPRFLAWFDKEIERRLGAGAWEVWTVVHRLALGGNLTAAKLFLDRFAHPTASPDAAEPVTFQELAKLAVTQWNNRGSDNLLARSTLPCSPQESEISP